jgi:DMSO/TMAO reductase YedYZ molybdopterin-dependent catalytic subunit
MAALLSDVGARGDTLVFHSADRYAESVPRRDAERAGAMVAYAMNGVVLPRAHGYPARAIIPGLYGFKNIKWLERIEVAGGSYDDEWRGRGWTAARIHTTTRIDVARRQAGSILVAGIAFAGNRGIRAVEVRANGGPWYRATLGPPLSDDAWVQWVARLPDHGTTTVDARAIDGTGRVQDARRRGAFPDGATGWASATV